MKQLLLSGSAFIATAIMLTVIQVPISWSALAWVSLVPFILASTVIPVKTGIQKNDNIVDSRSFDLAQDRLRGNDIGRLALAAYLISFCYWLGNLYWIAPITIVGWVALCLYMAVLWPILALCLRYCRIKKIPLFLAVPVLFVGAERLQGLFLGGFFWRFLAHSQYANVTLIQIADIFGAAGLSFLVAMVNGLIAELIITARLNPKFKYRNPKQIQNSNAQMFKTARFGHLNFGHLILFRISDFVLRAFKTANLFKVGVVCAALVAVIIYGRWRLWQSYKFIEDGPLVASLQSNVPQSVKRAGEASDAIFDELLQKSEASAQAGAELIVWPETMVQATLDPRVLRRLTPEYHCKTVDKTLREHSKDTAFVLVGAYGGTLEMQEDLTIHLAKRYNSSFLYKPDGTQADKQYNKIHLVLFGEVLPFRKSSPLLFKLLMKFNPYGYDHSLDAGSKYTVFEMTDGGKSQRVYKFSVMICYEDTIPVIARRFALDGQGRKQVDWLVNISNDGWFVKFKNGKPSPSTELAQHAAVCVFRAVENRLAVLRSVNTGISCLIDTLGHIHNGFIAGTLPHQAMARQGCAGWFVDRVPIDRRTTFFSKYGQWLDFCCALCFILLIIVLPLKRFSPGKKPENTQGVAEKCKMQNAKT